MPLVNPTDQAPKKEIEVPVQIAPAEYKGVTVDTAVVPIHSLITHVEGQPWTVDYYQKVKDQDTETSGQNVTREGAYDQYIRIKFLELRVSQALESRQEAESKQWEIVGAANTYPGIIPSQGDMLIADVGDGREGVFKLKTSQRMSILKAPTYQITYEMAGFSDDEILGEGSYTRIEDLNSKVIKTVFFVKDYIQRGLNPIIEEEDYYNVAKLARAYGDMVKDYYRSFFSPRYSTLLPPGQDVPIYDAFLLQALRQMFETREAPEIMKIKNLNTMGDQVMQTQTIWDALLQREGRIIDYCAQRFGLNTLSSFRSQGMFEGIYYSGIVYVVYPRNPELSIDDAMDKKNVILLDRKLQPSPSRAITMRNGIPLPVLDGLPSVDPILFKPVDNDYYIFSQAFYDKDKGNYSALEALVWNYLDGKALSVKWLLELYENYRSMGGLERFYYTPIILFLMKACLRSI